jgi:hypothetical protein
MPRKYSPYPFKDIGLGIDTYSPKDKIPEGALSDVLNMDPEANSTLSTRKGYARYYGNIPLRVVSAEYIPTEGDLPARWQFQIDSAQTVSLANVATSPLLIAGELSNYNSESLDFKDTFSVNWYKTYNLPFRETFEISGTTGTKVKTIEDTGLISKNVMFGASFSDSSANSSNTQLLFPDAYLSDGDSSITLNYEIYDGTPGFDGYFYYKELLANPGVVYAEDITVASSTWTVENNVHNLATLNFVVKAYIYDDVNDRYYLTEPSDVIINLNTGGLTVEFEEAVTGKLLIYATEEENTYDIGSEDWQEVGEEDGEFTDNTFYYDIQGIDNPFNFVNVWLNTTQLKEEGGVDNILAAVIVAKVKYDYPTRSLRIYYQMPFAASSSESVKVCLLGADYKANVIEVEALDDSSNLPLTDSNPRISIWGIEHDSIYREAALKGGHTHHIDRYRSSEKQALVTALGGNLFESISYAEGATTYAMPVRTVRGSSRVVSATTISPLFLPKDSSVSRTRGSVKLSNTSNGYATAIQVDVVNGEATYFIRGGVEDKIDLTDKLEVGEILSVTGCVKKENNGEFRILSFEEVKDGEEFTNECRITVSNEKAVYEGGILAKVNVFYDKVVVGSSDFVFKPGDNAVIGTRSSALVVDKVEAENGSATLYFKGVTAATSFSDGLALFVRKTSSVFPLASGASENVDNFVRGDVVDITGFTRKFTVKQVNALTTSNRTITKQDGYYQIDFGEGNSHGLNIGDTIIITDADTLVEGLLVNFLDAEWTLGEATTKRYMRFGDGGAEVDNGTEIATAILVGKTIELEEPITISAGPQQVKVNPEGRWVPVESPALPLISTNVAKRVPDKEKRHFDENVYSNQPYIKSTAVQNSLYLTNNIDEVKKFDGQSIYNSGLPPFQAWAFIDSNPEIQAFPSGAVTSYSDVNQEGKYFEIDNNSIVAGERVKHRETGKVFTVSKVAPKEDSVVTYKVFVKEDITQAELDATDTNLVSASSYRYYIKHTVVDVNNQEVSSAMLGADDLFIEIFESCAIQLKICAMPAYPGLNHAFIDTEIYRTKANTVGPFYRVARYRTDYEAGAGYIVHNDAKLDDAISSIADLDPVSSNLLGGELGTRWTSPPKSKVMTTASNILVLGNISSPPILDVVFRKKDTVVALSVEGDTPDFHEDTIKIKKKTEDGTTANQELTFEFLTEGEVEISSRDSIDLVAADFKTNITPDEIELAVDHNLVTGDAIRLIPDGISTLPSLLYSTTTYYVITDGSKKFKLAASRADALADTPIPIEDFVGAEGDQAAGTFTLVSSAIEVFDGYAVIYSPSHSVAAGDWVYFFHSTKDRQKDLRGSGWYRVDEITENDFTISTKHQQATALGTVLDVDRYITSSNGKVPVWLGTDGNFNYRYEDTLVIEDRAATRLSLAINSVMATENPENSYWASPTPSVSPLPWLLSQSGQSYPTGELRIYQADALNGELSFTHSSSHTSLNYDVYVNNLLRTKGEDVSEIRTFNSRLCLSYRNNPEIFNDCYSTEDRSGQVIDINPADGQEITAAVPFFGSSAFGSAQLAQAVVVFKTNSIYLVDLQSNNVSKLQTQGQGCTAPRSVAVTKNGIFFANESGVYRLDTAMKISWMGKALDGKWNDELNKSLIEEMAGHNYAQERRYKLSYPIKGNGVNSHVVVYDSAKEDTGDIGSWTIYDNHPSTGWCNLKSDAFFGGLDGRVYRVRNDGTKFDYRDDDSPISQYAIFGATSFGMPDERKITESVTLQFQNEFGAVTGIKLLTEQSLSGTFNASGTITIPEDIADKAEGDEKRQDTTVRFSLPQRKGTHVRAKIEKEARLDEKLQLSSLTYGVRPTGADGVPQANKYRS